MSWARHFDRCIDCGRDDRRHKAKGRCEACDSNFRYQSNPAYAEAKKRNAKRWMMANHARVLERVRKYEAEHPDRVREYKRRWVERRRRLVKVEVAGQWLEGLIVAYRHEDGERVADVRMPSGRVITFPRSALCREVAP